MRSLVFPLGYWLLILILCILGLQINAIASEKIKNSYSSEDVLAFKRIGQVVASPNGKQIAFTSFQVASDASGKQWQYSLYLKNQAENPHLLEKNNKISVIRWSPDGRKIGYLAQGKKFQSIWIYDTQHKTTKKLLELDRDIDAFKWSPNNKMIAFMTTDTKSKNVKALMPIDVDNDYVNSRLYIVTVNSKVLIEPLTPTEYSISEFIFPGFDWSPDSRSIVFAYQPRAGALYSLKNKIAIVDILNHKVKKIPYTDNHIGIQPAYSPDGKWIAFRSNLPPSQFAPQLNNDINLSGQVCIINTVNYQTYCLANTFNQDPYILGWNAASDYVYVLDFYRTLGPKIYALNLDSTKPIKLISNVNGFIEPLTVSLNDNHTIFGFGYETVHQAPQAFIANNNPFTLHQISQFSSPAQSDLGSVKVIHWKSSDGMDIEGLLLAPPHYNSNKKYPLYVAVHGGPAGAWWQRYLGGCDEYAEMIDPTTCWGNLLSQGFIILEPNPRGSTGYGQSFKLANFADFGGGDYHDVKTGIDYLIQQGIADPNHLAIGGWSFGGYMTAWAISQTHRFKAAVEGDGNTDFISFSGTSDIPYYYAGYLGSTFWDNPTLYLQRAPISHVKNIDTPLLILQGAKDIRVPPTQSYELYTALKSQNKPVKMLLFPEQGHVPMNANIIYESIKEIDQWLSKWLKI